MKNSHWVVLGIISVACAAQVVACSSSFKSCEDTRTCASNAGAGGDATAGADTAGGAISDSAGAPTGASGGVDNSAADNGGAATGDVDSAGAGQAGANSDGLTTCDDTLAACQGSCIDLDKDPMNCGACAHDCLGGACTLGVCQPIEMAKGQGRLIIVAVDDRFIYWGGDGAIVGKKSLDNSGESGVLVASSGHEYAYDGALAGQTLYWVNDWNDNGVRGCLLPNCTGGPSLLIPASQPPDDLIYSASVATLYWSQSGGIWHKPLPAGPANEFVVTTHAPGLLAADDSFVYWAEGDSTTHLIELRKVALAGGTSSSLVTGLRDSAALAPYGKNLFVLASPTAGAATISTVALPNGIGSASPKPFAAAGNAVRAMRVDDSGVYWTQRDGSNGSIRHCPLSGCSADSEILAPSDTPWGITTDANAVYWTTEGGSVMRLAK